MNQSKNRGVIITGATSGIGMATAKLFANKGNPILISGRREDRALDFISEFEKINSRIFSLCGDITDENFIHKLFEFSNESCKLNSSIFVLSAGHGLPGSILNSDSSKWKDIFELNYLSALRQMRICAELFMRNTSDQVKDIVVIGSTAGRNPAAINQIYASTKVAIHGLVEALRQEVCNHNIRVTLIEPGFVKTEFQEAANYDKGWVDKIYKDIGPFLKPEDVARTIEFVVDQPDHVHIDDVRIRPIRQK